MLSALLLGGTIHITAREADHNPLSTHIRHPTAKKVTRFLAVPYRHPMYVEWQKHGQLFRARVNRALTKRILRDYGSADPKERLWIGPEVTSVVIWSINANQDSIFGRFDLKDFFCV